VDVGVLSTGLLGTEILPKAVESGLNSVDNELLEALLAADERSHSLECLEDVVVDLQLIDVLVFGLNVRHILQRRDQLVEVWVQKGDRLL
jgi:hypothetical protein